MASALSSWVTGNRVAGVDTHSLPKRGAPGRVSSSNQSFLGDTAVVV